MNTTTPNSALETPIRNLWWESRVVLDVGQLALGARSLLEDCPRAARPDGVIVFPGFGTGDWSTYFLRRFLIELGYDARGWGRGTNPGRVDSIVVELIRDASILARQTGGRIHLVGWSHGGILARQIARRRPDLVQQVITMGTPVIGGPKYTAVAERFEQMGTDLDALEARIEEEERASPLQVPVTAIFSRTDGIVSWQACQDAFTPEVEHVEVVSSHAGLGFHPEVWRRVAERLVQ
jgi:pimeloyl-ACP methyl ester carboxylesterase